MPTQDMICKPSSPVHGHGFTVRPFRRKFASPNQLARDIVYSIGLALAAGETVHAPSRYAALEDPDVMAVVRELLRPGDAEAVALPSIETELRGMCDRREWERYAELSA